MLGPAILQDESSNPAKLIIISIVSAPVSFPIDRSGRVPISLAEEGAQLSASSHRLRSDESRDDNDGQIGGDTRCSCYS